VFLNLYKKCVDRTGIPQIILQDLCGILNRECNRILNEIADFELDIKYDPKGILRIYTSENGMKIPASMASGYQKFVMDMIMRIVLASCLSQDSQNCTGLNNISNPNMLIIDEGFGCLDKKNFIEVAKVLKKLKKNFKCVLVITHIEELKTYADKIINIERANQESKLEYMERHLYNGTGGDAADAAYTSVLSEMQRVRLQELIDDKAEKMRVMRLETNKKQAAKKEQKEAAKKEKQDAKKEKQEAAKKSREDKRLAKMSASAQKVALNARVLEIMADEKKKIEYLIEVIGGDAPTTFTCRCCNSSYTYSIKKVNTHVNATSYKSRHKKFIKGVL